MVLDPPAPPALRWLCRIECEVAPVVSLGAAPLGERRYVPLTGGQVTGGLRGSVVPGGVDWQIARADGALDLHAHYVLALDDGSLVEVDSRGLRHGPADVMQRLAAGEAVDPAAYFFRTAVRLTTGAPAWLHLNRTMAIAVGAREAARVRLDLFEIG